MPDEPRTSVLERALSWVRRRTAIEAAGFVASVMLVVAAVYAVAGAGAAPAREPAPTATPTASPTVTATASLTPTATPTATATTPPTATATDVPTPPPTVAAPVVEHEATPPPPTSTPVPPRPAPAGLDTSPMDAYSLALFNDTNNRRIGAGLPPLRANGWLVGIARIRSRDMADHHYFAHVSPVTGEDAFSLMDKYGIPYGWAGENLAENNYPLGQAVAVADTALWNSPPHRENILNPNFTDMGIALVVDASGMNYFTIIFTGPP